MCLVRVCLVCVPLLFYSLAHLSTIIIIWVCHVTLGADCLGVVDWVCVD